MKRANFHWLRPQKSELSADFEEMIQARGLSPLIGQLLWQRNIRTAADLQSFLEPDLQGLHDPFLIWKKPSIEFRQRS